ncbi:DUF1467 family protein [Henriciella aquimarina]|uniref:DUF1467 family protein n=1 Tax=Henriciella aquimarina TaxID=545261 RepID=UPI000A0542FD|nr:DUF1467 family protein [Henriciella aquimarina]
MNWVGGVVVFLISWWVCLFVVLPIGVRGQFEEGDVTEGTEEGAPARHMMPKKLLWATIGAAVCTVLAGLVVIPLLQYYGG